VSVLEDGFGETQFVGASEPRVLTPQAFKDLIEIASSLRRTSATEKNEQSSRSHAICKITITDPVTTAAPDGVLYLIDLAGSEAARDIAHHAAERMKETRDINISLSVLKDCIRGRAAAGAETTKKAYVPFRQSALTKTLKHLFDPTAGRVCKMSVVACINPSFLDVSASKNTLRYADMLRVPVAMSKPLIYQETHPSTWNNEELKKWIVENVSRLFLKFIAI
jgi:kinesin family protein 2/24